MPQDHTTNTQTVVDHFFGTRPLEDWGDRARPFPRKKDRALSGPKQSLVKWPLKLVESTHAIFVETSSGILYLIPSVFHSKLSW